MVDKTYTTTEFSAYPLFTDWRYSIFVNPSIIFGQSRNLLGIKFNDNRDSKILNNNAHSSDAEYRCKSYQAFINKQSFLK